MARRSATSTWCRWPRRCGRRRPRRSCSFPARYLVQFMANHQMLQVSGRPQWRVVQGGSSTLRARRCARAGRCSERLNCAGVRRVRRGTTRRAGATAPPAASASTRSCWPATATRRWRCWPMPTSASARSSARCRYQANDTVLHTDARVLPRDRKAWAAWNAYAAARPGGAVHGQLLHEPAAGHRRARAARGHAEPHARRSTRQGAARACATTIRCYDHAVGARRRRARPRSRAGAAPGSPAPTGAGASTRTACAARWRSRRARRATGRWQWRVHATPVAPAGVIAGMTPARRRWPAPSTRAWCAIAATRRTRTRSATGWRSCTWTWTSSSACSRERWLWSVRARATWPQFRRSDYLGDPAICRWPRRCATRVEQRHRPAPGRADPPAHPPALLRPTCSTRSASTTATPPTARRWTAIVAEITNTPWKERHAYVLPVADARSAAAARCTGTSPRRFHVSPFMPMDCALRLALHRAGRRPARAHGRAARRRARSSTPRWCCSAGRSTGAIAGARAAGAIR